MAADYPCPEPLEPAPHLPHLWLEVGVGVGPELEEPVVLLDRVGCVSLGLIQLAQPPRAGVPLVAGSDYPNAALAAGSGLLEELCALTDAGLSPFEALTAATVTAGRAIGDSMSGSIAPGARADLVLLSANPLTDLRALDRNEGVMAAGRWFSRQELDRRAPRRTTPARCSRD